MRIAINRVRWVGAVVAKVSLPVPVPVPVPVTAAMAMAMAAAMVSAAIMFLAYLHYVHWKGIDLQVEYFTSSKNIIFPQSFPEVGDLEEYYRDHFVRTSVSSGSGSSSGQGQGQGPQPDSVGGPSSKIFKPKGASSFHNSQAPLTEDILTDETYTTHTIETFDAVKNLKDGGGTCSPDLMKTLAVEITRTYSLASDMNQVVARLAEQIREEPPMKELRDFFLLEDGQSSLEQHVEAGDCAKYWLRFAGTSVWLEEYRVHFMVSRVMYLPSGYKRGQLLSLTYGQLFDEHWRELHNTELVIPSNKMDGSQPAHIEYRLMKFPSFLPVPLYHNAKFTKSRWYGAEDPRIILVKNDAGFEEPLIVYNQYHRKVHREEPMDEQQSGQGQDQDQDQDQRQDTHSIIKFKFYRSIFMSWAFQFQRGKVNVDGMSNPLYDSNLYLRTAELRRSHSRRLAVEKNWTPFVNPSQRSKLGAASTTTSGGGDHMIYFIYRWKHLEILKCQLTGFQGYSLCEFEYKRDPDLPENEPVGELRGGTQMLNLRDVIKHGIRGESPSDIESISDSIVPRNKEIWLGFARAHLGKCGCGFSMYRPNLAVITRDNDVNEYKITQLSSYITLNVDVPGWEDPKILCAPRDANALIPNGIAHWSILKVEWDRDRNWRANPGRNSIKSIDTFGVRCRCYGGDHPYTELVE
ncbi:beta-mannosyltransferase 2 [[Candida] anglica]|uniref:Beta-mannosyltransferase 2 n=1 Tax=[Candida] anglica TaxID=148631 RepID=A0ABP0E9Q3_9ASCO